MTSVESKLVVSKLDVTRDVPDVRYCVSILSDMTWKTFVFRREIVTTLTQVTATMPQVLSNAVQLSHLLYSLDKAYICEGNRDAKFECLLSSRRFSSSSSKLLCMYIIYIVAVKTSKTWLYVQYVHVYYTSLQSRILQLMWIPNY